MRALGILTIFLISEDIDPWYSFSFCMTSNLSKLLFIKIQWFYCSIVLNTVVYYSIVSIVLLIVLFNCLNCSIVVLFEMQWFYYFIKQKNNISIVKKTIQQYIYCSIKNSLSINLESFVAS